jgi:hypothetical protein
VNLLPLLLLLLHFPSSCILIITYRYCSQQNYGLKVCQG